ncbi:CDP-glycerol glycerophosphotransferase family protein [Francisella adeliensis]|uniref:CDP-glycerol glycerophosphotransferase family protein n=1 Tax=Francisella adeliensis TaxID=2007306 RepID=UPI001BC87900|nr:CDP-glycerol glycerophosphotransferase family protein [Francisella adeliensis]MBK2085590.1 CDP-glycerol glycerophosphotransferase family protein [Francisella adeliensis]
MSDNMLAIFEAVKNDPKIKKIILTKNIPIDVTGKNIKVLPMRSLRAVYYLLCSNLILVQHSVWLDLKQSYFQINKPLKRNIINLWHGIPIKHIGSQNINDPMPWRKYPRVVNEMERTYIITSSDTDLQNMASAFNDIPKMNFWITGLPRNDFLLMAEQKLPQIFKNEINLLKKILGGKKMIIYAPTYHEKNVGGEHYSFARDELDKLNNFLMVNDMMLGVRYHPYLPPDNYSYLFDYSNITDMSSEIISDIRVLIRDAAIVITDYSSLFIDACYINKKCISFAYDLNHYKTTQRGFFYSLEDVFPGPVCRSFEELMISLSKTISDCDEYNQLNKTKELFFKYIDLDNTNRVVNKIKMVCHINS